MKPHPNPHLKPHGATLRSQSLPGALAWAAIVAVSTLSAALTASAQTAPDNRAPLGRWVTESGNLEVDIAPCGDALCGKVVKVLANRSMSGASQDMEAADTRPALGMTILRSFRPVGGGEFKGQLYNRENAKTYTSTITPAEPDQLIVHAYVGIPLFGKSQVWRRPSPPPSGPSTLLTEPAAATAGAKQ